MNRDDLLVRGEALPLVRARFASLAAVYPQESGGGTWTGVNQHGISFALLNWAIAHKGTKIKSRGQVIPRMLVATTLDHARMVFEGLELDGIFPFRLIGLFGSERAVSEWRWDGECTTEHSLEWGMRHWFSSGASDEQAELIRSAVCAQHWRDAWNELDRPQPGKYDWLRRLHASHEPEQGIFSICAHRDIGGTLSYTEIEVTNGSIRISYSPQSPCKGIDFADSAVITRAARTATFA
jgi:hypothetical protein